MSVLATLGLYAFHTCIIDPSTHSSNFICNECKSPRCCVVSYGPHVLLAAESAFDIAAQKRELSRGSSFLLRSGGNGPSAPTVEFGLGV